MYVLRIPVILLILTADSKIVIALTLISYVVFEYNSDNVPYLVMVVFVEIKILFPVTFTLYPVIASPPVSDGGDH